MSVKFFESGTNEFIIVRACAMLMFLYISYLMYFIVSTPTLDYSLWKTFFEGSVTKIFSGNPELFLRRSTDLLHNADNVSGQSLSLYSHRYFDMKMTQREIPN